MTVFRWYEVSSTPRRLSSAGEKKYAGDAPSLGSRCEMSIGGMSLGTDGKAWS